MKHEQPTARGSRLRERAATCVRLAQGVTDQTAKAALVAFSKELLAEADRLGK